MRLNIPYRGPIGSNSDNHNATENLRLPHPRKGGLAVISVKCKPVTEDAARFQKVPGKRYRIFASILSAYLGIRALLHNIQGWRPRPLR